MTFAEVITVFASLATCVTAIVILFTLFEMKKQRNLSYKPAIVPITQRIISKKYGNDCFWSEKPIEDNESVQYRSYPLHLYNLGNGAAKDIHIKWQFDIQSVISTVNSLFQKNLSQISTEIDDNNWLSIKRSGEEYQLININLDMERSYGHLLPVSTDKSGILVGVPNTFITLVSHYFHEGIKRFDEDDESYMSNVPSIDITITFKDISGTKYTTKYSLYVNLHSISALEFDATFGMK